MSSDSTPHLPARWPIDAVRHQPSGEEVEAAAHLARGSDPFCSRRRHGPAGAALRHQRRMPAWTRRLAVALVTAGSAVAALSAPPAEGWTEIATTARKQVLLQRDSIRPHGDAVEAWTLYRYDELQHDIGKVPYRSSRYLYDYDCRGGREKPRRIVSHNGPLEVHDIDLGRHSEWKAVGGPTTVSGIVFKHVCAGRR